MNPHKYRDYSCSDFVNDDAFRRWVKASNTDEDRFWQQVLSLYPAQAANIDEAREVVLAIQDHFDEEFTEEQIVDSFAAVQAGIAAAPVQRPIVKQRRVWWSVAATALLLVGLASWLLWNSATTPSLLVYQTGFGEQIEQDLPDGSRVTLNANSRLEFADNWESSKQREVWLEGEAYFEVENMRSTQVKFIVHTPVLDVEVYGTQFNVNTQHGRTTVVLEEGEVQVALRQQEKINLRPGERITYNESTRQLERKTINTQLLTSWKDGLLLFEATHLEEVLNRLQAIYNVRWQLADEELLELPMHVSLPSDNLEECLETLELLLSTEEVTLTREGSLIRIR
ncbi:MAG: FecR domain-containing protein [Bacteroidota bacterium]